MAVSTTCSLRDPARGQVGAALFVPGKAQFLFA